MWEERKKDRQGLTEKVKGGYEDESCGISWEELLQFSEAAFTRTSPNG